MKFTIEDGDPRRSNERGNVLLRFSKDGRNGLVHVLTPAELADLAKTIRDWDEDAS